MTFTKFVSKITSALGSPTAIAVAFGVVFLWGLSGPFLDFSETWQLIINTTTTITTGLMVFILLNADNRDSSAIQTKLDAILEALDLAPNDLVGIEDEKEKVIKVRQQQVREAAT